MKSKNKVLFSIRIIASLGIIVMAMLQLFGVWKDAIKVYMPLMGVNLLLQTFQDWKRNRSIAIFSLCVAVFIFICTGLIFLK